MLTEAIVSLALIGMLLSAVSLLLTRHARATDYLLNYRRAQLAAESCVERMRAGVEPSQACEEALERIRVRVTDLRGQVALIALRRDRDALTHFERFRWADGLDEDARDRYELAHERAHHYCRWLNDRFPRRADTPALLSELRRFYRASPESKLRAA